MTEDNTRLTADTNSAVAVLTNEQIEGLLFNARIGSAPVCFGARRTPAPPCQQWA